MKAFSVVLLCAGLLGASGAFAVQAGSAPSPSEPPFSVTGYKQWTRVNKKPHRVTSALAMLCRSLTPEEKAEMASDPHKDKYVTVYVNKIGRAAMLYQKTPLFPQGSVIVKEKRAKPDSKSPELLTVMRKREKGYNPVAGDWEYLVLSGTGEKMEARGRLANCQSCHARWKETDHVSRVYFTDKMRSKFR